MKSSLSYLDQAADAAMRERISNPSAHAANDSGVHKRIHGIKVIDREAVSARQMELEHYRDDALGLRKTLADHGITVLAMMPKKTWDTIASDAGLFRFNPKQDGTVPASSALLTNIEDRAREAIAVRGLSLYGLATLALAAAGFAAGSFLGFHALGITVMTIVFAFLGLSGASTLGQRLYFSGDEPKASLVARLERALIRKAFDKPSDALMRQLWPSERFDLKSAVSLKIGMPPAPMEAQDNLVKAADAGFSLTLYAVAEAISFLEDPADAFIGSRSGHWAKLKVAEDARETAIKAERARRAAARAEFFQELLNDPIVAIEHGSVTAIVVQYGDFPVEQAVIDRVLASEHLI